MNMHATFVIANAVPDCTCGVSYATAQSVHMNDACSLCSDGLAHRRGHAATGACSRIFFIVIQCQAHAAPKHMQHRIHVAAVPVVPPKIHLSIVQRGPHPGHSAAGGASPYVCIARKTCQTGFLKYCQYNH